jgi:hypothetical protein
MQYLLLIYMSEKAMAGAKEADTAAMHKEYGEFTQAIVKSGNFRAGDALQPTKTATTVRVREGKMVTTDGPFAETKEQLGGYYLVDAKSVEEAVAIAARIPGARNGSIEVRPIVPMQKPG